VFDNLVKELTKSLLELVLNGSKDPMKQMKAHETRFKQPQDGTKLGPKPTPISKRNITREKHRRGGCFQRKNNLANLGNKASKKVSILDMPRKAI
jgi:hypothetical protein